MDVSWPLCLPSKSDLWHVCQHARPVVFHHLCMFNINPCRSQAGLPFASKEESGAAAAAIARYCIKQRYRPGDVLWREGQPSDEMFIIERGSLLVQQRVQQPGGGSLPEAAGGLEEAAAVEQQPPPPPPPQQGAVGPAAQQQQAGASRVRLFEFGPGCVAGAVDFYLRRWVA